MSKYHKSESEWEGFKINKFTVISKVNEYQYKKSGYTYAGDLLLVECECQRIFTMKSVSFLDNLPEKCRFCHRRRMNPIGETCGSLIVEKKFHNRNKSNRSVIWLECKCRTCNSISIHKADVFRQGESSCWNCKKSSRFISSNTKNRNMKSYFSGLKYGAKKRNISFDVTSDYLYDLLLKQDYKCSLSGIVISIIDGTASIDRINNEIGYLPDNVQWVHRTVNYMKCDLPQSDFIDFCEMIFKNKKN